MSRRHEAAVMGGRRGGYSESGGCGKNGEARDGDHETERRHEVCPYIHERREQVSSVDNSPSIVDPGERNK